MNCNYVPMQLPKPLLVAAISLLPFLCLAQNQQRQAVPRANVPNWLKTMDKNGDGKIANSEATGLMKRNFNRVDANKDGALDKNELTQLASRLRRNNQNQQNNRRRIPSNEELIKNAPMDVVIEPDIPYRKGKSEAWKLDLVMPKAKSKEPRAAIVFVHGGGWRSGDKRAGYFMRGAIEYAQKGYVCITVNYRLIKEAPMPASIEDVKCAVRWLRANAKKYNVDPKRIGAYGNSAGAHLVCMLGLVKPEAKLEGDGPYQEQSSLVQAVCASATPTNFLLFDNQRKDQRTQPGELFAGPAETLEERGRQASPSTYVAADAPPFLLVHGTADTTVNIKHGDTFHAALKKAGAKHLEYVRVEGAGHGVFHKSSKKTYPAMEKFFKTHLRGTKKK
ncbi:MAG: alpha/beta hydrolase fold domain-containing protein [Verrucomicrobiota bacterium]|nr:alpha/beta hydrolase fold domain-containing protein [Verrucomicrobiota bacterium]